MASIWNIHYHPTVVKAILFLFPVFYVSVFPLCMCLHKDKQTDVDIKLLIFNTYPIHNYHGNNACYVWEVITFIERVYPAKINNITKKITNKLANDVGCVNPSVKR